MAKKIKKVKREYGNIPRESVLEETDYLMKMTQGAKTSPILSDFFYENIMLLGVKQ